MQRENIQIDSYLFSNYIITLLFSYYQIASNALHMQVTEDGEQIDLAIRRDPDVSEAQSLWYHMTSRERAHLRRGTMEKVAPRLWHLRRSSLINVFARKCATYRAESKGTDGYGPFRRRNGTGNSARKNGQVISVCKRSLMMFRRSCTTN